MVKNAMLAFEAKLAIFPFFKPINLNIQPLNPKYEPSSNVKHKHSLLLA